MLDIESKMVALELQWRDADDLLRAARAELAANESGGTAVMDAIRQRIARAEAMKQKIMQKIVALEDEMD